MSDKVTTEVVLGILSIRSSPDWIREWSCEVFRY